MPIRVTPIVVGLLSVNAYLVEDVQTKEAILIDPGDRPAKLLSALEARGIQKLNAIWITHVHFDHIAAAEAIVQKFDCPIYVSQEDFEGAKEAPAYGKMMAEAYNSFFRACETHVQFVDFDTTYQLGQSEWHVLPVAGHSKQSICLYFEKDGMLFDGDTLFLGAIGREDMYVNDQGGTPGTLLTNIRQTLLTLPKATKVYPGHGLPTTIGNEQHFMSSNF